MELVTCPNCKTHLTLTLADPVRGPRARGTNRLYDDERADAVRAFTKDLSGRFTSAALRRKYDALRSEQGWPELSDKALARALKVIGAQSWRTSDERGWTL